jgi:hypothetical protein
MSADPRFSALGRPLRFVAKLAAVAVVVLWLLLFAKGAEIVYILFVLVAAFALADGLMLWSILPAASVPAVIRFKSRKWAPILAALTLVAGVWYANPWPCDRGQPIAADVSQLVLRASDLGPGYHDNWSKSGGTWVPCVVDEMTMAGRIAGYQSTVNTVSHDGYLTSMAYKYIDEVHATTAVSELLNKLRAGAVVNVCEMGARRQDQAVEQSLASGAQLVTYRAGGRAAVWRNHNIVEKIETSAGISLDLDALVGKQNQRAPIQP